MSEEVQSNIKQESIYSRHINPAASIERSKLLLESKKFWVPLEDVRIWNSASNAVLPNAAVDDDLGMILGTTGTAGHSIQTSDAKTTTVTQKARFTFTLPECYYSGGTISLCAFAGMLTTAANGTATIDFSVYLKDAATIAHGFDIVTTAATTINSLTLAEKAFVVTPTGIANGDELTALLTIAITDSGTGTAVKGLISKLYWSLQIQG